MAKAAKVKKGNCLERSNALEEEEGMVRREEKAAIQWEKCYSKVAAY